MANTFSLILVLVTLVTGIVWALDKYRWAPRRRQAAGETLKVSARELDAEQVAKVAPQPSWVENMASIFPVIAVVLVLRSFIYEPFQIPSGSMMPTLLVGDFILVEKFAYGLRDPAFHTEIVETGKPERGDIVVFKYPPQPNIDYIKRTVGLPGDTVVYEDKRLCIQPKGESQCQPVPIDDIQPSQFIQAGINLVQAQEQLGEQSHQILVHPKKQDRVSAYQPRPGVNRWVVPDGHYFMMGDNRDNSADSRFWGFVPERNLVGKAVAIWVSFEFERPNDSWLPSWVPTGIRFNRIGGID